MKTTTQATIMLLILKELRLTKAWPQAYMADVMGKTTNYWNKIENAQGALSLNDFLNACSALQVHSNSVLLALENYKTFFRSKGWYVSHREDIDEDYLWVAAQEYYNTDAFKNKAFINQEAIDILSTPLSSWDPTTGQQYPWPRLRLIFRYAADPYIKAMMDNYRPGAQPEMILLSDYVPLPPTDQPINES